MLYCFLAILRILDFRDFIKVYPIPEELVSEACGLIDSPSFSWTKHSYSNNKGDGSYELVSNGDIEPDVHLLPCSELSYKLSVCALDPYLEEFPYAASPRFSSIRFNRYHEGQLMKIHSDSIESLFSGPDRGIPVLSIVGLLRSAEEGGNFIFTFPDGETHQTLTEPGTIVVFPSHWMYRHEVTPVIKGVRDSYVAWTHF